MTKAAIISALERLHEDSFAWAARCCYGDRALATDILQVVYLKILEGKAVYKQKSAFKTWLFSVIRFTAINHHRKRKIVFESLEEVKNTTVAPAEIIEDNNYQNRIFEQCLCQLSPRQSQILHLVFYQQYSIEEAAEIMSVSTGTARTHYKRGKEQLKQHLLVAGITPATFRK
ncbi:MAG: RNA polymerase sigma factor [Bacteroidota bacterium]